MRTEFEHFSVNTLPCEAPAGRDWGAKHWRFLIRANESGAMHKGYYSAGEACQWSTDAEFHADVLESLGVDALAALEFGGDVVPLLEALEDDGLGLVDGYWVAVELMRIYEFVSALTEAEFAALTGDCGGDE